MRHGQTIAPLVALALLAAGPAPAQTETDAADAPKSDELKAAERYTDCLRLAAQTPEKARGRARTWEAQGGGDPARHCLAVALLNDGQHTAAAKRLEELARTLDTDSGPLMRAEAMAQAGQAWLLAGELEKAETAHSKALNLNRDNAELWVDRAMVRFQRANYAGAVQDLNRAQSKAPDNAMVYVYRASALRHLDRLKAALEDAETAVELAPRNPEALLEKGILHRLQGDKDAARQAWTRLLEVAPTSPAAEAARTNLTQMKSKTDEG
ncbi:Tetratricopeptide repeat-containing protein [Limimonas halophila]|uniref:Tetratricopeptide repeat-containing protein n=1 Tax=Limimonas halophila TaxID=1082479 RepID=A0A1G7RYY8_9PROT|nr:tetratricopeptide repeat protein [Limimonas halophila]SDG15978.1 Tetratricopeptide repeat-containing protein [Limimonas halophila]